LQTETTKILSVRKKAFTADVFGKSNGNATTKATKKNRTKSTKLNKTPAFNVTTIASHFAISASRRLSKHASNNNVTQLNKVKLCKQKQPKSSA
jgi:hypothetical protein